MNAPRNTSQPRFYRTPITNQHTTWPDTGWYYCTVATTYMFLYTSTIEGHRTSDPKPSDLNGVYEDFGEGRGTQIARYIEMHTSLTHVEFQGWSTPALVDSQLTLGFPVPIGISHWDGAVFHRLSETAGNGYNRRAPVQGETHPRDGGDPYPAGHWAIVVGYDRSNYYVNDPDSATLLRWSRSRFESHNPYMVRVSG